MCVCVCVCSERGKRGKTLVKEDEGVHTDSDNQPRHTHNITQDTKTDVNEGSLISTQTYTQVHVDEEIHTYSRYVHTDTE